jgi:hypothetical protein
MKIGKIVRMAICLSTVSLLVLSSGCTSWQTEQNTYDYDLGGNYTVEVKYQIIDGVDRDTPTCDYTFLEKATGKVLSQGEMQAPERPAPVSMIGINGKGRLFTIASDGGYDDIFFYQKTSGGTLVFKTPHYKSYEPSDSKSDPDILNVAKICINADYLNGIGDFGDYYLSHAKDTSILRRMIVDEGKELVPYSTPVDLSPLRQGTEDSNIKTVKSDGNWDRGNTGWFCKFAQQMRQKYKF